MDLGFGTTGIVEFTGFDVTDERERVNERKIEGGFWGESTFKENEEGGGEQIERHEKFKGQGFL